MMFLKSPESGAKPGEVAQWELGQSVGHTHGQNHVGLREERPTSELIIRGPDYIPLALNHSPEIIISEMLTNSI